MVFKFWKSDGRIKRPADYLKKQNTFDVLSSEMISMSVVDKKETIRLTCHDRYENIKLYDIIYRSPGNCLYSLYRTKDKLDAKIKFNLLSDNLSIIHKELISSTRTCYVNAQILENAVQSILKYHNWLPIHFAARFGLSNFFRSNEYRIYIENHLNTPSKPLQRSPLMLAILSNELDTIKSILNLNPRISLEDRRGNNVLHFAAICSPKIWSPVFKYCMSFNYGYRLLSKRNNKFVTPIHFVCYSKKFENIIELLKIGLPVELLTVEPPYVIRKKIEQEEKNLLAYQKAIIKEIRNEDSESSLDRFEIGDKPLVQFTGEMISDLKFEDMVYGGTPLHWCQHKRTLDRLIEYEFNVNAFDLNNETAITKCIKGNRLKCLVILLNAGADPNLINKQGNTSLHEAVLSRDIAAVQACICWDVKLDLKNKAGETARHLASIRGTIDDQLIVHILHSVGASRCDKNMLNCRPDCSCSGLTNGKKYSKWPSFERETPYFPFLNQKIVEKKLKEEKKNTSETNNNHNGLDRNAVDDKEKRKVKMVCFDGGGTKGLISGK